MISEEYRQLQSQLHKSDINYGTKSVFMAPLVSHMINKFGITEMLDYGAGKGRLESALEVNHPVEVTRYEPSNDEWNIIPEPSEFVCCIDVLEHIEPEYLDDVILDLKRVTKKYGLFTIHTSAAVKILPDGRNAHLTQKGIGWWLNKLDEHFRIKELKQSSKNGYWIFLKHEDSQENT